MERRFIRRRVKAIFAAYEKKNRKAPDVILFYNDTDPHLDLGFFYATGLVSGIYEGSIAVCHPEGDVDLITSPLEASSARKAGGFRLHVPGRNKKLSQVLKQVAGHAKVVGVHSDELTHAGYRRLKKALPGRPFVDMSAAVLRARIIKDELEIEKIKRACTIGSKVAQQIPGWLKLGVKESEVAAEMAYEGGRLGAQAPSFDTIAAFGKNAAEPHYTELTSRLRRNQFALFDFGYRYDRYCSDITRTFFFGKPRPKDRRMYETVRHAQDVSMDLMRPGSIGKDIHLAAEKVINATEFRNTFIHGLGHGLGLAVHDGGGLNGRSELELKPGMVLTVEPGVYLEGYGGVRIEDDVLVTPRGHRILTTATRDFLTV